MYSTLAIASSIETLPKQLRRSLTWDQGADRGKRTKSWSDDEERAEAVADILTYAFDVLEVDPLQVHMQDLRHYYITMGVAVDSLLGFPDSAPPKAKVDG